MRAPRHEARRVIPRPVETGGSQAGAWPAPACPGEESAGGLNSGHPEGVFGARRRCSAADRRGRIACNT